jgi:ribosome maturation factor RimP
LWRFSDKQLSKQQGGPRAHFLFVAPFDFRKTFDFAKCRPRLDTAIGTTATGNRVSTKTEQLQAMIAPAVTALGYEMWGLEYLSHTRPAVLRVFIDSENGINVEDCAAASRQISGVLDVEDPIDGEYTLEVSSPGMDRPLFSLDQYSRYAGNWVKLRLRVPFDGRRNFRGVLRGVEGDEVVLIVDDHEFLLPIELVDRANVVPQFSTEKSSNEKNTNIPAAQAAVDAEENDDE